MQKFLKRQATVPPPTFYHDVWVLLISKMEWPELYAMTHVCQATKRVAHPLLLAKTVGLCSDIVMAVRLKEQGINSSGVRYYRWNLSTSMGWDLITKKSPFGVNLTDCFELMMILIRGRCGEGAHPSIQKVQQILGEDFARFARISGIVICRRPKQWLVVTGK